MINRVIIIFLLFIVGPIFSGNIFATDGAVAAIVKDSTKRELLNRLYRAKSGDTALLTIYNRLSKIAKDTAEELYYINKLLEEAKEQGNNKYICTAYYAHLVLAYNTYDVENVNKWYRLLEPIARKEKLYDMMFRGRRGMVDMFNITGNYEREEKEALKMLEEAQNLNNDIGMIAAYQCLSYAYRDTFRNNEAVQILEKGYEIANRISDMSSMLEINNLLISTYQTLQDQANILKWTNVIDAHLKRMLAKEPSSKASLKGWFLLTHLAYLSYYIEEDDLNMAAKYLDSAQQYQMKGYGAYERYYYSARLKYFSKTEDYEKSLIEVDNLIELYKELSPISYGSMNFRKAHILEQLGELDSALALYRRSFFIIDSIYVTTLKKQTEQLRKDYNTDQLLLRNENIQNNTQTLFLGLVGLVIIILLCFVFYTRHVRKGLRKSEEEMRRMTEEMKLANTAKELFLSNISTSISTPLNAVVDGSLKLASDEVDLSERQFISHNINQTSSKLLYLINNILDLSRLEAKMMKFKLENIEIKSFVQEFVMNVSARGTDIELILPETADELVVNADSVRLYEVFNNLVTSSDGAIKLVLSVSEDLKCARIEFVGTILLTDQEPTQEVAIVTEVNRLLIESFGGEYTLKNSFDNHISTIVFVLPLI